jgi:hypothetical protein
MKSRVIKPGFFLSEELAELDVRARLLFIGLWLAADREGRFEWRPKKLRAEIFPHEAIDVEPLLMSLHDAKFICMYRHDGKVYGFLPNFRKHQKIHKHEAASVLPAPPDNVATSPDIPLHDQTTLPSVQGTGTSKGTGRGTGKSTPPSPVDNSPETVAVESEPAFEAPLTFPEGVDDEECRIAWDEWVAHRRHMRKPYRGRAEEQKALSVAGRFGREAFLWAVKHSLPPNSYQGLFPEKYRPEGRTQTPFKSAAERRLESRTAAFDEFERNVEKKRGVK